MHLSVIICTHNPRENYLRRTLEALERQTLPKDQWELLLIDNASKEPLAEKWDLSWHPLGRHIRDDELGLTPARLRGIREARGEVLVFVDDDNLLSADYLQRVVQIGCRFPVLGAWGGSSLPEFETPPPAWALPHLDHLALRVISEDRWCNFGDTDCTVPWGAGMCVRKCVADTYASKLSGDTLRRDLDRRGSSLISGGDEDLAMTAIDLGMGTGLFRELCLTHLIPEGRLQLDYLLRLKQDIIYSTFVFWMLRGRPAQIRTLPPLRGWLGRIRRRLTMPRIPRLFFEAALEGQQRYAREFCPSSAAAPQSRCGAQEAPLQTPP